MLVPLQIFLIVLLVVFFVFFNTKKGNNIFEKRVLLKSLLFSVSLFIKIEDDKKNKESMKNKIQKGFARMLLGLDMWLLNNRSEHRKENVYIKNDDENKKKRRD